eukprot:7380880-Prymnesium_polylepis.2
MLEPPHVYLGLNGLRVRPCSLDHPHIPKAASGSVVLAIGIAPASMSFWTTGAVVSGFQPARPSMALVVSVPATSTFPLIRSGTPSSGRRAAPPAILASWSAACLSARSFRISMHAFRSISRWAMASSPSCTRCTQVFELSAWTSFIGCGSDVRRCGDELFSAAWTLARASAGICASTFWSSSRVFSFGASSTLELAQPISPSALPRRSALRVLKMGWSALLLLGLATGSLLHV